MFILTSAFSEEKARLAHWRIYGLHWHPQLWGDRRIFHDEDCVRYCGWIAFFARKRNCPPRFKTSECPSEQPPFREEEDRDKLAHAWSHQPVVRKLTDFGESRSFFLQTRSVCRSRTLDIDRGTVPFMPPEILIGSGISLAGATVEDLLRVDKLLLLLLLLLIKNYCYCCCWTCGPTGCYFLI